MEYVPEEPEPEPGPGPESTFPLILAPVCPKCGRGNQHTIEVVNWYSCYNEDLETVIVWKLRCPDCGHEWTNPATKPVGIENADEESSSEHPSPCEKPHPAVIAVAILLALLIVALIIIIMYNVRITLFEDFSFIIKAGPRWW